MHKMNELVFFLLSWIRGMFQVLKIKSLPRAYITFEVSKLDFKFSEKSINIESGYENIYILNFIQL